MSEPVDFSQLLSTKAEDVKRPQPIPSGTYTVVVKKFEPKYLGEKKTPAAELTLGVVSAGADVDTSLLGDIDLTTKELRKVLWLSSDAQYRTVDFANKIGVETTGKTLSEILGEFQGLAFNVFIKVVPNQKDPTVMLNEVTDQASPM